MKDYCINLFQISEEIFEEMILLQHKKLHSSNLLVIAMKTDVKKINKKRNQLFLLKK